jgi:hypothetical protein
MARAPRRATSAMASSAIVAKRAASIASSGSITSMRWCLTPPSSAAVGFADPMSKPR